MPAPARLRERVDGCPGVFAPHDAADGALARVRLPGGAISAAALRVVADCADDLGDGRVHLTSRGNLQLRGLARTPALAARLAAAGLLPSTTHERVRNVLASPLAGIASGTEREAGDRPLGASTVAPTALGAPSGGSCDVRPLASALDRALCARPGLAALPGRFLFAIDDGRGDVATEDPDLCWRAASGSTGVLLVAGVAVAEVAVAEAVRVLLDAAEVFLTLREADGATAWRAVELAGAPARIAAALRDRPGLSPLSQEGPVPEQVDRTATPAAGVPGPVRRDDGGTALVVAPLLGELTADQVRLLADAASPTSSPAPVVPPCRTVVLPDPVLPTEHLARAGLVVAPGPAADVSACAGRPGCAKALADVRADARAALGLMPAGRVHVSGCARRCGAPRTPHADAVAQEGGGYLVDGLPRAGLAG